MSGRIAQAGFGGDGGLTIDTSRQVSAGGVLHYIHVGQGDDAVADAFRRGNVLYVKRRTPLGIATAVAQLVVAINEAASRDADDERPFSPHDVRCEPGIVVSEGRQWKVRLTSEALPYYELDREHSVVRVKKGSSVLTAFRAATVAAGLGRPT